MVWLVLAAMARAVSDAGQIVGVSDTSGPAGGGNHGFFWSGGRMTDVGVLSGVCCSDLYAINTDGAAVGETIERVVANLSGGFSASRIIKAKIGVTRREIADSDMRRVLEHPVKERQ